MMTAKKYSLLSVSAFLFVFVSLYVPKASASLLVSEEGISPNHSAEYTRSQSRNASTDVDAVYYNPAGLAFLPKGGIYLMLNSINTYTQKNNTIGLWGSQGINAFSGFPSHQPNSYQSSSVYLSQAMVAMPSDFSFIFKKDNWVVFANLSTLYGQPGAKYSQGASTLDRILIGYNTVLASLMSEQLMNVYSSSRFERKELHIGATVGGSYAITDQISSAFTLRYINIQSSTKISQTPMSVLFTNGKNGNSSQFPTSISTDVFGNGIGLIAGFDFKPTDSINIGTRIEYYPPMILTKHTNKFFTNPVLAQSGQLNIFCDSIWPLVINDRINPNGLGNIFNMVTMDPRTLKNISNRYKATYPPSLSAGASFRVTRYLKLDTSADLTFPRARDLDGREKNWNYVGYRLGQGIEWNITTWITASVGYSYHDFGLRSDKMTEIDDLLASHTVGAGCSLYPTDYLTITASGSYSYYASSKNNIYDFLTSTVLGNQFVFSQGWNQKLSRNEWSIALGVTFSMYPVSTLLKKKADEHYWKGMSSYLSNDIDTAIDELKSARTYNPYCRDVDKKIRELTEVQKYLKKNIQQDKEDKAGEKNGKKE